MTKKIVHVIIFLIVAGVVTATFATTDSADDTSAVMQLPALMLAGVYLGIMFVLYALPAITDKATTAVLDSGEMVERDPLYDARAAYARGDYEESMEVYRSVLPTIPTTACPGLKLLRFNMIIWKILKPRSRPCVRPWKVMNGRSMMLLTLWAAYQTSIWKISTTKIPVS